MGTDDRTDATPANAALPPPPATGSAPEPFVITTPTTTLTLDDNRRGQLSVSVTNVVGRPLRVRLHVEPGGRAATAWFAVAGTAEREVGLGATEAYTVDIAVPPDVTGGRYQVRIDAHAEDRPDETFTLGPSVAFTVPAARRPRSRRRWLVVATVAAVILLAGVVIAIARTGDETRIAVPGVTGQAATAAIDTLKNAGLDPDPSTSSIDPCDPPVTLQDPTPGDEVEEGERVTLTVGDCVNFQQVPGVVGLGFGEGDEFLSAGRFKVEVAFVGTTLECDPDIVGQKPLPGEQVVRDTVVVIAVPRSPSSCPPGFDVETRADPFDVFPQFEGFD